jgi:hypothetical protein
LAPSAFPLLPVSTWRCRARVKSATEFAHNFFDSKTTEHLYSKVSTDFFRRLAFDGDARKLHGWLENCCRQTIILAQKDFYANIVR